MYSALAWYFSQVWPSSIGVPKPFYFILLPSYWFPTDPRNVKTTETVSGIQLRDSSSNLGTAEDGAANPTPEACPEEAVNESLLGLPTVVINRLRKTFGTQLAVNNLSFKMYENQIFALLGHNGAGKVRKLFVSLSMVNH